MRRLRAFVSRKIEAARVRKHNASAYLPWARSELERELRQRKPPTGRRVSVFVSSLNNCAATELCIRSLRQFAGHPFELTVGDAGSTDGSIEMLKSFEVQGWLRLQVAPAGRSHEGWLNHWRQTCDADLLVFVHADVEFRRAGWLRDLVAAAWIRQAALVCGEMLPEMRNFVEPVGHRTVRAQSRPCCWVFLIDRRQTAAVPVGFDFHKEETDAVPEGMIIWDVGGWFFEHLRAAGLTWVVMPDPYRRMYHHFGGFSWIPLEGKRGRKKRRDLQTVRRHLQRLRLTQVETPAAT